MAQKEIKENCFSAAAGEVDESIWISRAKNGCVKSFESLYKNSYKRIYLFSKRMIRIESEAEDVVQETFIRAWQNLSSFREQSQFYTWIRTIAVRIIVDRMRLKNAKIWSQSSEYEDVYSATNSKPDQQKDLQKLIEQLPDGARSVLILHDIEGYKHQEIASFTGIAVGTSKAQLFRARSLLRNSLS